MNTASAFTTRQFSTDHRQLERPGAGHAGVGVGADSDHDAGAVGAEGFAAGDRELELVVAHAEGGERAFRLAVDGGALVARAFAEGASGRAAGFGRELELDGGDAAQGEDDAGIEGGGRAEERGGRARLVEAAAQGQHEGGAVGREVGRARAEFLGDGDVGDLEAIASSARLSTANSSSRHPSTTEVSMCNSRVHRNPEDGCMQGPERARLAPQRAAAGAHGKGHLECPACHGKRLVDSRVASELERVEVWNPKDQCRFCGERGRIRCAECRGAQVVRSLMVQRIDARWATGVARPAAPSHSGMFPCFFGGFDCRFDLSSSSPRTMRARVSRGWMIASR